MNELSQTSDPQEEIKRIIASARSLGVEMDEEEAIQWLTSISAAEGSLETDLIMAFIRLHDGVTGRKSLGSGLESTLREMQADINRLVNQFFEERLRAIPEVCDYLDSLE